MAREQGKSLAELPRKLFPVVHRGIRFNRSKKHFPVLSRREYSFASQKGESYMCLRLPVVMLCAFSVLAQSQLTNEVKAFVKYDQPTIVLNHVRLIDGTGAAAKEDQSLAISNGKIQSIALAAGAQAPQGATVL